MDNTEETLDFEQKHKEDLQRGISASNYFAKA